MNAESRSTIRTFPLTVVYGQVDKQIEAGRYDRIDKSITARNFSVAGRIGKVRFDDAKLVLFGICQTSDMVIEAFANFGFRPGNADEILAVGIEYPDIQKDGPVVALGSVLEPEVRSLVQPDPYRGVIFLLEERGVRELSLSSWSGAWRADCQFLGFPIESSR